MEFYETCPGMLRKWQRIDLNISEVFGVNQKYCGSGRKLTGNGSRPVMFRKWSDIDTKCCGSG